MKALVNELNTGAHSTHTPYTYGEPKEYNYMTIDGSVWMDVCVWVCVQCVNILHCKKVLKTSGKVNDNYDDGA